MRYHEQLASQGLVATLALSVVICALTVPAHAAERGPAGAWRTTNECFLAVFILGDGGRAAAAYLSGERDENAAWTWDGNILRITSQKFPLDSFTARVSESRIDAEYVWHDFDKDELNRQSCAFERVTTPAP
jgi:hypothetical protein